MSIDNDYRTWLEELLRQAREEGLEWLVDQRSDVHRKAFEHGCSPSEELRSLQDLSTWRGCGCGGG